ncbi:hypothetical protein OSTOST_20645 [Ostertagia ostertagi]
MDDLLAELNELLHAIKMPVVGGWSPLLRADVIVIRREKTGDPPGAALCLLDHISTLHPNLHAKAFDILEIIAPPFSDDLISLFLPLVSDEEIFDKAAHERFPAAGEFIQYCRERMSTATVT